MPRPTRPSSRKEESGVAREIRNAGRAAVEPVLSRLAEKVVSGVELAKVVPKWDHLGMVLLGLGRVEAAVDAFLRSFGLDARLACQFEDEGGKEGSMSMKEENEELSAGLDRSSGETFRVAGNDAGSKDAALQEIPPASDIKVLAVKGSAGKVSLARERRTSAKRSGTAKTAAKAKSGAAAKKSGTAKTAGKAKSGAAAKKSGTAKTAGKAKSGAAAKKSGTAKAAAKAKSGAAAKKSKAAKPPCGDKRRSTSDTKAPRGVRRASPK